MQVKPPGAGNTAVISFCLPRRFANECDGMLGKAVPQAFHPGAILEYRMPLARSFVPLLRKNDEETPLQHWQNRARHQIDRETDRMLCIRSFIAEDRTASLRIAGIKNYTDHRLSKKVTLAFIIHHETSFAIFAEAPTRAVSFLAEGTPAWKKQKNHAKAGEKVSLDCFYQENQTII
jgi:hypothetical protein